MDYLVRFKELFLEQINGIYYSDLMIILILSALVTIVPGYVLHVKKGVTKRRVALAFFTASYFGLILMLTVFRRAPGSRFGEVHTDINLGMTLTSVYSVRQLIYSIMNFALFVPWGVLLGLYRTSQKASRNVVMTTLIGFITSFCIELIQLVTGRGRFEVTDLFTNVLGTFFGGICVLIGVNIKRMTKK